MLTYLIKQLAYRNTNACTFDKATGDLRCA